MVAGHQESGAFVSPSISNHCYFDCPEGEEKPIYQEMDEDGEEESSPSFMWISEERTESLFPIYFGISCAFFALDLQSGPDMDDMKWSETRIRMLQGSAHLLGLLIWRVQGREAKEGSVLLQKLEEAEKEVKELKRMRSEDAKANEKVVSIFASQEQSWLSERKNLKQQIGTLINELRVFEVKREEAILNLNKKAHEKEIQIQSIRKEMEEEKRKRKELEEKLRKAEVVTDELRGTLKREAEEHSFTLWKQKTAFIEVVSNQRRLEAEMARAFRKVEAAKQEVELVFKEKEESVLTVQKLSMEVEKLYKDLEQKDKLLSIMLRKSKLDTTEKQILLKEVKISKTKRKKAELESERWKAVYDFRHDSSRSEAFLSSKGRRSIEAGNLQNQRTESQINNNRMKPRTFLLEYFEAEHHEEEEYVAPWNTINKISNTSDRYPPEVNSEPVIMGDTKQLEDWVHSEIEKYTAMLEQRHDLEINAFVEQMGVKEEKLEVLRWQLLSMELESERLQTHIEGLEENLSQLMEENMKLEALLLDREAELKSVKEKFSLKLYPTNCHKINSNSFPRNLDLYHKKSKVKLVKRKSQENKLKQKEEKEKVLQFAETEENRATAEEIEVEKEVTMDPGPVRKEYMEAEAAEVVEKLESVENCLIKKDNFPWKIDIHAFGISYKIKRLKQQLLMVEKLAGTQGDFQEDDCYQKPWLKGFLLLMSLLKKQISRYESLEQKTDDLCKRMHEKDLNGGIGDSSIAKTKEQIRTMEQFLDETFQLQRYMVAIGQKMMGIQSKIAVGFVGSIEELNESTGFNMRRFAVGVRTLFREVQRGFEIRIAHIIGDLEGTLACDGIIHLKN